MPALTFPGPWCFSTEPGAQARPAAHSLVTSSWGGDRGNQKMMNIGKFRIRKSWTIYALCQASLLRNTASYILFAGRERDRESWLSNVVTENTGYLRPSCTRADITKTQGLEASSQKPQIDSFEGLAPAPDWTLSSLPLGKSTELIFPFSFMRASEKSSDWPGSQQTPEITWQQPALSRGMPILCHGIESQVPTMTPCPHPVSRKCFLS